MLSLSASAVLCFKEFGDDINCMQKVIKFHDPVSALSCCLAEVVCLKSLENGTNHAQKVFLEFLFRESIHRGPEGETEIVSKGGGKN